jgi:biopolymer transport protein ExbD
MRVRRPRKTAAHLEITAFINLIVVLVPFLLSTAVFSRLAVMDLSLPAPSNAVEQLKVNDLKLEVVIRRDAYEVGDRIGGLIQRIERPPEVATDTPQAHAALKALSALMVQIKQKFPDKTEVAVLAEPETPYDHLVQVMDAVRAAPTAREVNGHMLVVQAELFPDISVGDAPVRGAVVVPASTRAAAPPAATSTRRGKT